MQDGYAQWVLFSHCLTDFIALIAVIISIIFIFMSNYSITHYLICIACTNQQYIPVPGL